MRTRTLTALAAVILALSGSVLAGDWPQWNGPKRDGHADEKGLLKKWPEAGPKLLWTYKEAGTGYTAPAVVGGKVYTMGCRGDDEFVICLDAMGKQLWATKIGPVFYFKSNQWNRGPNGTPSVDGKLLYAVGSQGILVCVDITKGEMQWQFDLPKQMGGEVNNIFGGPDTDKLGWGYCWSPLVDGDNLIITPGGPKGLVAALDKKTGKEVWRSKTIPDQATYSSPIVADVQGVRQYIVMVQSGAVGVSAKDGSELALYSEQPIPGRSLSDPYLSQGSRLSHRDRRPQPPRGADEEGRAGFNAKEAYKAAASREMVNALGGVILVEDDLYGSYSKKARQNVRSS